MPIKGLIIVKKNVLFSRHSQALALRQFLDLSLRDMQTEEES